MRANQHPRQAERLIVLRSYDILDTPREAKFDAIVQLAAELCETPIAVMNLIDDERQWFKSEVGLGIRETPIDTSICSHVILQPGLTIIHDTLRDPRMSDNPLCLTDPHLRFYAGALLEGDDGLPVGTLCVLDHKPRDLTDRQKRVLTVLADQIMAQLRLRRELQVAVELRQEVDHRVKNSLSIVSSLLGLQANQSDDENVGLALRSARDRVAAIASIHDQLHEANSSTVVDIGRFAHQLAESLGSKTRRDVDIRSDVPSVEIAARDGVNVGIILNELVTNALRHGFALDSQGQISISGQISDGRLKISVADTGRGLPANFDPAHSSGLGMRLALSLTRLFGGPLAWSSSAGGTVFSFDLPIP